MSLPTNLPDIASRAAASLCRHERPQLVACVARVADAGTPINTRTDSVKKMALDLEFIFRSFGLAVD
jgi:hypothetical protein